MKHTVIQQNETARAHRLALTAWLWVLSLALAEPGRILDIRPQVLASGPEVRLEELVVDASALTREQRDEIVLAPAPALGDVQQLALVDLAYRLQRSPGLLEFSLRGPARITIQGGGDPAFLRRCERELTRQLEQTAPWDSWSISVRFGLDDERRLAQIPPGFTRITVKLRDTSVLLGSVAMDVVFADDAGEPLAECTLSPTVLREVKAMMTAEGCDRGHVLDALDLRPTSVWMGGDQQPYVTDPATAVGCELNRRLGPGELLLRTHLAAPLCAERGEVVRVVSETAGMNISMNAVAVDGGRLGDTIRLRNTTSDAVFRAVLSGRKTARFLTR